MKIRLTLTAFALSLLSMAQTVERMDRLQPEQKAAAERITLTGRLSVEGNSDFRQLRDLCWQLREVNLADADCPLIPDNAFHSRSRLESVVLPRNLRSIGSQAFYACRSLRTLVLPAAVEQVGSGAFSACCGVEELTIEGRPELGEFAFAGLRSLHTVRLLSATPPPACPSTFEGMDRRRVRLEVPKGSERKYRRAPGWSRFFEEPENPNTLCRPAEVLMPMPADLQLT